jgi:hypothetical protein
VEFPASIATANRAKRRQALSRFGSVIVDFEDFKSALDYPVTKIKRQIALLEQYHVGGLFEEDEGRASLRLNDPSVYLSWADIDGFCEAHSLSIDRFLVDLQFALLD